MQETGGCNADDDSQVDFTVVLISHLQLHMRLLNDDDEGLLWHLKTGNIRNAFSTSTEGIPGNSLF